ncbi:hypothetical protein [Solirubrum puertoriconensis]|uniref:hypothetical protein n=1 Tax=Solirubrum puertoriconensis TaxID=1751427 RepID=UPI00122DF16B|nr:hypothetical protein [Solirubrum puertoriconensis]
MGEATWGFRGGGKGTKQQAQHGKNTPAQTSAYLSNLQHQINKKGTTLWPFLFYKNAEKT